MSPKQRRKVRVFEKTHSPSQATLVDECLARVSAGLHFVEFLAERHIGAVVHTCNQSLWTLPPSIEAVRSS